MSLPFCVLYSLISRFKTINLWLLLDGSRTVWLTQAHRPMPRRLDMGKDEFGLKGVITEHYPVPRILQANDTFHCQPPMPLKRALADLAGRMRIGQMISWAHKFMISLNSTFPLPQLPSTALWSEGWTAVLSPSDAQSLHWFLSINTGNRCEVFRIKDGSTACVWRPATEISLWDHISWEKSSPPHTTYCILVLRKFTTCGSILEIITENHLCLHTCFWYYQLCYIHFLEVNRHIYRGSPKEDLRGRPYL